jgi:hypothetical protein
MLILVGHSTSHSSSVAELWLSFRAPTHGSYSGHSLADLDDDHSHRVSRALRFTPRAHTDSLASSQVLVTQRNGVCVQTCKRSFVCVRSPLHTHTHTHTHSHTLTPKTVCLGERIATTSRAHPLPYLGIAHLSLLCARRLVQQRMQLHTVGANPNPFTLRESAG